QQANQLPSPNDGQNQRCQEHWWCTLNTKKDQIVRGDPQDRPARPPPSPSQGAEERV
ncbi:hypothetical protein GOP47_0026616, partial [Adiantum capillus-veneris]